VDLNYSKKQKCGRCRKRGTHDIEQPMEAKVLRRKIE
jgi:hypothetical protein